MWEEKSREKLIRDEGQLVVEGSGERQGKQIAQVYKIKYSQ